MVRFGEHVAEKAEWLPEVIVELFAKEGIRSSSSPMACPERLLAGDDVDVERLVDYLDQILEVEFSSYLDKSILRAVGWIDRCLVHDAVLVLTWPPPLLPYVHAGQHRSS